MPTQKDLKRLVRARMKKTGEAYTAARQQLLKKTELHPDFASLAGMRDETIAAKTGRSWAEWVRLLDAVDAARKPHRAIAAYVSSLGTPDWWSQTVTVGYERIRGLRDKGQRRGGGYEANRSRTFSVPVDELFAAFASTRRRSRWLPVKVALRTSTPHKHMRLTWDDGTLVQVYFQPKGATKSAVAVTHAKLTDRPAAEAAKTMWAGHLDRLGELLTGFRRDAGTRAARRRARG